MRKFTILLAAAPLALLAACGDNADDTAATNDDAMADTSAADSAATPAADDTSGPATRLADARDLSGTYSFTGEDGTERRVTLDADDRTYRYTAADGIEKTGRYTVDDDGYRFYIKDFYGRPTYFAFRDGYVYELPDNVSLTDEMIVQGNRYARADGEDEVFSREPELGSPVVPPDVKQ